ncbi:DUF1178 family protein [Methylocapsa acidiphila]|uniref:DUF1178 family protein n=1 Tax=Methylocapsa acidiphila TaxID=133552 RepID=UPI0004249C95|nr:DUF1178 family protein [Methylocapsa acidiphila]
MIKFALVCHEGHEFESWFQNGAAFDRQADSGLILCPNCGSAKVAKAIMAPALASRSAAEPSPAQSTAPAEGAAPVALLQERDHELRAMINELRTRIFTDTDNVGAHFFEEASKIHQGLAPERPIHGLASFEEARALLDEGVGILPIPPAPADYN